MPRQPFDDVSRRRVMKVGAATAGATTLGFAISGTARQGGRGGGKSGGRGQTSDEIRLNVPFTVEFDQVVERNASCMSDESAQQEYNQYVYTYCDEEDSDKTFCVIPDDSDVNENRTYEFRSVQDCKGSGFSEKFSFGPANSDCPD